MGARIRKNADGEVLTELTARLLKSDQTAVLPELNRVDLTVTTPTGNCLIELKTFPTNYGGAGKPITNFIASVVRDLEKLSRMREEKKAGCQP